MGSIKELAETIITTPSVLKAWAKARYVHLTMHGRGDVSDPMNTHLVLSGNDRLFVSDLLRARQPFGARLVTLAACEAAVTSGRQGIDEVVGFPAALLRAGVGQVLAPLWPVDDYATFRLMDCFYAQLGAAENIDLAIALARTTAEMRTPRQGSESSSIEANDRSGWLRRLFHRAPAPAVSAVGGRRGLVAPVRSSAAPDPDLSHPDYWAAFAIFGLLMSSNKPVGSSERRKTKGVDVSNILYSIRTLSHIDYIITYRLQGRTPSATGRRRFSRETGTRR
jgi:CHAT domain-containing protein